LDLGLKSSGGKPQMLPFDLSHLLDPVASLDYLVCLSTSPKSHGAFSE